MTQPFHARLNISKHDPTDQCTTNLSIHDPTYLSTTQPIYPRPNLSMHDPVYRNTTQPNLSIYLSTQLIYARPSLSKYHLTHLSTTQPILYVIQPIHARPSLFKHDPTHLYMTQPINDPTYPSNILSIHSPTHHHATTQFNETQRSEQYNRMQLQSFQRKTQACQFSIPPSLIRAYNVDFMVQTLDKRTLPHRVRLLQSFVHFSMTHYSLYLFFFFFSFPPAAYKHSRP